MTIDNQVAIGVIMTTAALVVSNLALLAVEIAKRRANRPQTSGGWLMRFLQSPWQLPPFLILINVCLLVVELRSTAPVTGGRFTKFPRLWPECLTEPYSYF